jgi:hypothetical protein
MQITSFLTALAMISHPNKSLDLKFTPTDAGSFVPVQLCPKYTLAF